MNGIQDILNGRIGICTQSTNGKSVTTVTIAVAEDDVTCWPGNHQAIVAVVDVVILEYQIRAPYVESYKMVLMSIPLPRAIDRAYRR